MKKFLRLILALLLFPVAISWSVAADPESPRLTVSGSVTDTTGAPITSATVVLSIQDSLVAATSTNTSGHYRITAPVNRAGLVLRVSSVAYADKVIDLDSTLDLTAIDLRLVERNHEIGGIEVSSPRQVGADVTVGKEAVQSSSRRALVPTNPIVSLRQPQIARVGSSHSSQIRVNGSSPDYSLNGISIGRDPDHYGMFPVIPGTVVDAISFYPEGTPARYRLPTIIDLKTPNRYTHHHGGELHLSTIEATGTYSLSTERFFVLGSARKSILDRLVNQFDVSSDRRTLPPTNFRDIFFSSGIRISPHFSVATDQYYVRDYLSYNTGQISGEGRDQHTYQHTEESFISTRAQALYGGALVNLSLGARRGLKEYRASPGEAVRSDLVRLNLKERRTDYVAELDARLDIGEWEFSAGTEGEYAARREVTMSQNNWNFLPPFSNSDRPFVYQQALNDEYASFRQHTTELNGAVYLSVGRSLGRFELCSGVRNDYYSNLFDRDALSIRNEVKFNVTPNSRINVFYGTFSENPANNILEPYQILIRDWLTRLKPIRHRIVRAGYSIGLLQMGLFQKSITDMPVVIPDFGAVEATSNTVGSDFITVESEGKASFYGGTVSLNLKHFVSQRVDLYASYAYTRAYRVDNGVVIPYELNAPHRFILDVDTRPGSRWNLGVRLDIRSGYPYTPYNVGVLGSSEEMYTPEYYRSAVEQENSATFPINATLNVSGAYSAGQTELFFSISNVTDRGNPIINSASGYIYDAGILPSVGMRWRF